MVLRSLRYVPDRGRGSRTKKGGVVMATMKFIILSNPAACKQCKGSLDAGRGAWWGAGTCLCVGCYDRIYGQAEMTDKEREMIDELMAGNTNPVFDPGLPEKKKRGK